MCLDKFIDISKALLYQNNSPNKHFSFIVQKNRIVSIGMNNYLKTHPIAAKYGFKYLRQHSELSAIVKYNGLIKDLTKCTLVNVRLNSDGIPMISYPCKNCQKIINSFQFKKVFYTNKEGLFEEFMV